MSRPRRLHALMTRGQRMAQTQGSNFFASAIQESVVTNLESGSSFLGSSRKGFFDLVLATGSDDDHLQPKAASRRPRTLDVALHDHWNLWVHKQCDFLGCRKKFMQQRQPLWSKLSGEYRHPRGIATRAVEACGQSSSDGIASSCKNDGNR